MKWGSEGPVQILARNLAEYRASGAQAWKELSAEYRNTRTALLQAGNSPECAHAEAKRSIAEKWSDRQIALLELALREIPEPYHARVRNAAAEKRNDLFLAATKETFEQKHCPDFENALPNPFAWLAEATRGLVDSYLPRIYDETLEHFTEAVEEYRAAGLSIVEAESRAVAELGSPHKALRQYCREYSNVCEVQYSPLGLVKRPWTRITYGVLLALFCVWLCVTSWRREQERYGAAASAFHAVVSDSTLVLFVYLSFNEIAVGILALQRKRMGNRGVILSNLAVNGFQTLCTPWLVAGMMYAIASNGSLKSTLDYRLLVVLVLFGLLAWILMTIIFFALGRKLIMWSYGTTLTTSVCIGGVMACAGATFYAMYGLSSEGHMISSLDYFSESVAISLVLYLMIWMYIFFVVQVRKAFDDLRKIRRLTPK